MIRLAIWDESARTGEVRQHHRDLGRVAGQAKGLEEHAQGLVQTRAIEGEGRDERFQDFRVLATANTSRHQCKRQGLDDVFADFLLVQTGIRA